jgi:uncharacterized protein
MAQDRRGDPQMTMQRDAGIDASAVHADTPAAPSLVPAWAPRAFHAMAKPSGATCNLDCDYCFFLSKEMLYPGSRFRMAEDLQELYIRQLLEGHRNAPEVVVTWQGGEPTLMGLDFFRRSVELVAQYKRPGQQVLNTLQTNGTLLTDEWGDFLAEQHFLVGISIDGPRDIHDAYRLDKGGKGTFDRVMRGLDVLRANKVDYNILTTVHAANETRGREVYRFLRDECGATFMQFIPIVERATPETLEAANAGWGDRGKLRPLYVLDGSLVTDRTVSPGGYGRFHIDVFEEWVRRDIGTVYVQMFDTALANWYGEGGGMCVHAETCGTQIAVEHNGDVYSCDHFVEPRFKIGNIRELPLLDMVRSPQQRDFGLAKRDTLTRQCLDCDVRFACHGGCPKDRFAMSVDGEPGQHYLCPSYTSFFGHIGPVMRRMCELLRAGRAPSEVMATYAAADAQRGRKEPCTCGSGRKWKVCHGA